MTKLVRVGWALVATPAESVFIRAERDRSHMRLLLLLASLSSLLPCSRMAISSRDLGVFHAALSGDLVYGQGRDATRLPHQSDAMHESDDSSKEGGVASQSATQHHEHVLLHVFVGAVGSNETSTQLSGFFFAEAVSNDASNSPALLQPLSMRRWRYPVSFRSERRMLCNCETIPEHL